mgnify:CR=1 FL=1
MKAQRISMALKSQARFVLKGVRLPKWTLPNSEFAEKLDMTVANGQIESIFPQATYTNNITSSVCKCCA